jgi:FkbM family methyltransferase
MLLDLKNLIKKYDINIKGVIHIGAHFGQEFKTYENLNIKNIMFFEPLPNNFFNLKNNVGDGAILINKALGNFVGNVEMNVEEANNGMSSSILKPKLHLEQYPWITFNDKVMVEIDKLDNYIGESENYNFINIDVQGYELEVFKGGSNFLNHVNYIMTEVNNSELYENCAKVKELDDYLSTYDFERVETAWDGVTWGDALYIKKTKK